MHPHTSYNFDIDKYLNHVIPRNRVGLLPKPIAHFLGYRSKPEKQLGNVLIWFWSCIGAICGILVVEAVFHAPLLRSNGAPIIVGSLGASAILKYNTIDSPLSQPRNAIFGQLFSSVIGVSIHKLFLHSPSFHHVRFVGGALAVGLSSAVMGITKTVHPPAGATALLAVTSDEISDLGWFLMPLILLGATLMVAVACVVNNIQRRWPVYWWTPVDLPVSRKTDEESGTDLEKLDEDGFERSGREAIIIDGKKIILPAWVSLDAEEKAMLEVLRSKMEKGLDTMSSRGSQSTYVADPDPLAGNT